MSESQSSSRLPTVPDHPALEEEILAWWEAEGTFEKLREQNAGGPTFSFIDGPGDGEQDRSASTRPGAGR